MYAKLQHVIKIDLISNKSLIDDNMSTDAIVALRSVHDCHKFHDLKAREVEMTKDALAGCRQARKKYFDHQQSKVLSAERKRRKWKQEAKSMRILK